METYVKNIIFRDVTPFSLLELGIISQVVGSYKTLVTFYQATQCNISEATTLYNISAHTSAWQDQSCNV